MEFDFPLPFPLPSPQLLLPRRHYNAPCRVNRCTSVIGLITMEQNVRNSVICGICYKARKTIVNAWVKYIYKKRLRLLFLVIYRHLEHNQIDINKIISVYLV